MRFIRSRFGLVLWCAIALIILAVPLWRLRATRQLRSPFVEAKTSPLRMVTEKLQPSDEFGLSAPLATQAARRLPDDVGAQLATLDAAQFIARTKSDVTPNYSAYYQNQQQLARAQASLAARAKSNWKTTDAYFARFDELEKRFSQSNLSNLVRAAHLHAAMSGALSINEGPYFSYRYEGKSLVPTPLLMLHSENWMSPAAREQAIQTAREGAHSESDNAFWPWMEAILQFSLGRNDDALRALEAAGGKARFDDYGLSLVAQRLRVLKRLRATGWEDDWNEYSALPVAHFYKTRSAMRAVIYQTKLLRERGDQKRAFRWSAASARASSVVAITGKTFLCRFAGQALCAIAWEGAARGIAGAPKPPAIDASDAERTAYFEARQRSAVARFAQLARQNGDEALARQTLVTFQSFDVRREYQRSLSGSNALPARIWRLSKLYWLHAQVLCLSFIAAFIWCLMWAFTLKWNEKIAPVRGKILLGAMFFAGVSGAILVFARGFVPELDVLRQDLLNATLPTLMPEPNVRTFAAVWPYSVGALWIIFIVVGAIRGVRSERTSLSKPSRKINWKLIIGFALLCVFIESIVVIIDGWQPATSAPSLMVQTALISWFGSSFVGGALAMLWLRGKARAVVVLLTCALWTSIAALMYGNDPTLGDGLFYSQILWVIAGILALAALFFAVRNRIFPVAKFKEFAFQIAARTRIAAGVLALLCAVAYFGISLWTIPVEHQTRTMMQRQLQIGEVAWLREQIAARK